MLYSGIASSGLEAKDMLTTLTLVTSIIIGVLMTVQNSDDMSQAIEEKTQMNDLNEQALNARLDAAVSMRMEISNRVRSLTNLMWGITMNTLTAPLRFTTFTAVQLRNWLHEVKDAHADFLATVPKPRNFRSDGWLTQEQVNAGQSGWMQEIRTIPTYWGGRDYTIAKLMHHGYNLSQWNAQYKAANKIGLKWANYFTTYYMNKVFCKIQLMTVDLRIQSNAVSAGIMAQFTPLRENSWSGAGQQPVNNTGNVDYDYIMKMTTREQWEAASYFLDTQTFGGELGRFATRMVNKFDEAKTVAIAE